MENETKNIKIRHIKIVLALFLILISFRAAAPGLNAVYIPVSAPVNPYERLIRAVIQVESAGDTLAFNLKEEAIGAFQIRPIRLKDYNQRTGNNYKIEDCYNFEVSKKIFLYYAERIGYPDYETIAKSWNGSGRITLAYWEKVQKHL